MKERLLWPDVIRVVAIFLMVVLHVSVSYLPLWSEQSRLSWLSINLIGSLTRMCVPLFIMLSGALLLGRQKRVMTFYAKRMKRLLLPWFFWSVIYGFINVVQGNEVATLKRLIVGTVWTGFWILPVLLLLYVLTPLFNYLIQKYKKAFIFPFLLIMGIVLVSGIHLPAYFEYSFYFVSGFILQKVVINKRVWFFSLGISLLSWFAIMLLTYQLSLVNNGFVSTYYHYHTLPVLLLSLSGFVSIKGLIDLHGKKLSKGLVSMITHLSEASFGIYFFHMLLFRTNINLVYFPTYLFLPLLSIGLYGISYLAITLLQKNKLLNQVVG
jgi:surface polysaccharide O-acyltransferase-like enzyme